MPEVLSGDMNKHRINIKIKNYGTRINRISY